MRASARAAALAAARMAALAAALLASGVAAQPAAAEPAPEAAPAPAQDDTASRRSGTPPAPASAPASAPSATSSSRTEPLPPPASVLRRLGEIVARGGARPARLPDDPTAFTTVLRAADYDGEAATTEELLARAPGVQLRRFGGPGAPTELSIRGSTASQVVVSFDGVRLDTAQSGQADPSTVPLSLLERIEVARGGGSAQAGSNAIGGVVDFVPLAPGGPGRTRASALHGAFGTWQGALTRQGSLAGFDYALGWDGFSSDGDFRFERLPIRSGFGLSPPVPAHAERINNESERHATLLTLGRAFGEHVRLTVRDHLFYESRGTPGLDNRNIAGVGQRPRAHERNLRHLALARLDAAELGGAPLGARLELAHLRDRRRFHDPDVVPSRGRPLDANHRNGTLTLRGTLDGEHDLGALHQRVSTTLEHRRDDLEADDFGDPTRETLAWLVQDDLSLLGGRVRLAPALRWEHTEGFGGRWIPRVGLLVEPLPGLRLRGNLERAYRVPSFDELYFPDEGFLRGNPGLRPEESTDGDVGVELAWERLGPLSALRFEAVWFRRDIDESIVWVLASPTLVEPANTGPATVRGWELSGSLRLLEWVELSANHTRLDAELDATGTPLPGRAARETSVRLAIGPPSQAARLVVERQEVSEIPVTPTGNTRIPDRTVWDLARWVDLARVAGLRERIPADALRLGFEVANLTDELVRDAQYFPQPGRSWLVRLEGTW